MPYVVLAMVGTVALAALGADLVTAASAITSAIGAYGLALGEVGPATTYPNLDRPSRAVLVVFMLLGRLELFTLLPDVRGAGRLAAVPRARPPAPGGEAGAPRPEPGDGQRPGEGEEAPDKLVVP